ncbi:MAG: short-subunit dehydrogenase, partial [Glaciecola sp.]
GYGRQGAFHTLDAEDQDAMVRLNVHAVTALAHAAIPTMRARRRGGILNVASMVALMPVPQMAVYAATKAYVLSFSEAIHEEVKRYGINVTALNPGFTSTNFQSTADVESSQIPKIMWMDAEPVAKAGLDAVAKNKAVVAPGSNVVMAGLSRVTPSVLLRKGVNAMMQHELPGKPSRPAPATRERALITGASRGLGAEFARQLAAGGSHLVLTARTATDLEGLAAELRTTHHVDVEVLVADLAERDGVALVAARLAAAESPIDLFINNAGIGSTGPLAKGDLADHTRLIDVNIRAATTLAHAATATMVARGNGSVINVASLASYLAAPGASIYSAGKAYLRFLSEGVHEELQGTGVRMLALCPGFTRTNIFEASGGSPDDIPSLLMGEPAKVIATCLTRLDQPGATTVPVWYDRALASASGHLPRALVRKVAHKMNV